MDSYAAKIRRDSRTYVRRRPEHGGGAESSWRAPVGGDGRVLDKRPAAAHRNRWRASPVHESSVAQRGARKADSRAELTASTADPCRCPADESAAESTDLHDGAQQRLVSVALALSAAQATIPPEMRRDEGGVVRDRKAVWRTALEGTAGDRSGDSSRFFRGRPRARTQDLAAEMRDGPARHRVKTILRSRRRCRLLPRLGSDSRRGQAPRGPPGSTMELKAEDSIASSRSRDDGVGGAHPDEGRPIGLRDPRRGARGTSRSRAARTRNVVGQVRSTRGRSD